MIWVAVCDRDPQRRQQTGRLAARYLENRRGVSGRVALFANSDEMGRCGQLRFDICLMNVEAPLHLEAGKELRRRCPETVLLYYSSTQDPAWALEAFRAGASQYLPYPLEERSLWLAMDRAAWERDLGRESRIALNSTQGVVNLRLWDITYARSRGHRITFSLLEGEDLETKCLRVSFATVLAPLEPKGFLRCHDSYAINLAHAVSLTAEGVRLVDGTVVPVSTKKRALVREALKHCLR